MEWLLFEMEPRGPLWLCVQVQSWSRRARVTVFAVAGFALLYGRAALAHHPAVEQSLGHAQPRTLVGFDVDVAGFELAGIRGTYVTLAARGDFSPTPLLGLGARVPFHFLRLHDNGTRAGFGDVDLVLKVRVLAANERYALSVGLSTELPTGDAHEGLGSGHVELTPFVAGAYVLEHIVLHATVADNVSVTRSDHEHVNFVSPHSDHELLYHLGAIYSFGRWFFANAVVSGVTVLEAAERGSTLLVFGPQVGFTPSEQWRITLGLQVPFAGERRFD